ncbi:hypothetical protein [Rathayibacter toxicus]|nr:hypothetical protein [Rathayibacter toxicus]QOD09486.1 hypothetical protein BSG36_05685 [Rathayibacter toxicus]QWL28155.1 hypothetical protein E2R33_05695 [Rathayibacter toxicus]QWL47039.1 hypothetical protein E2R42_05560 [Rathayibacter toxicus]
MRSTDSGIKMRLVKYAAYTTIVALGLCLAGCSDSSGSTKSYAHGTRIKLYSSIEDLAGDSAAVIVGTVSGQKAETDSTGNQVTVSTFVVSEQIPTTKVGTHLGKAPASIQSGTTVSVRQLGASDIVGLAAPILRQNQSYLLFVTPSMLPGDEAQQFSITGASAGYYQKKVAPSSVDEAAPTFEKVGDEEGDVLPGLVNPSELK